MVQQRLLMCPPSFFDVKYVINPWMEGNLFTTQKKRAQEQWENFYKQLKLHVDILLISPQIHTPDLVFSANAGLTFKNKFILSHFYHKERQGEEPIFRAWFEKQGYEICILPNNIFFEGEGDALFQGQSLLWLGSGFRSEKKAAPYIEKIIKMPVVPLELINNQFYHLDTCFCPLDDYIMYFPPAFSKKSLETIHHFKAKEKQIILSEEDAFNFAGNTVSITNPEGKAFLFMNKPSPSLRAQLEALHYQIIIAPVDEFMKAGGANKCLVLYLNN